MVTLIPTRELLAAVVVAGVDDPILEFAAELFKRFFGISSSISLSGSLIKALINCVACLVDSVPPLIVIILSPVLSFCLSISMCAPVHSRIALMLHPPLPMTLDMTVDGTETFLDLLTTSFHPSSLF